MAEETCKARGETVDWRCQRPNKSGSQYCYWHSDRDKNADEIQAMRKLGIEAGEDTRVEGALFFGQNLEGANFQRLKLVEAKFGGGTWANLKAADFSGADLWRAQFRGSDTLLDLSNAKFNNASLQDALFENACLDGADFSNAVLRGTTFKHTSLKNCLLGDARRLDNVVFDDVTWEIDKVNIYEQRRDWLKARRIYEIIKEAYTREGDVKTATEFFYREMECRRKGSETFLDHIGYTFFFIFWGYGERPFRAIGAAVVSILFFAILYVVIDPATPFLEYLYFSAVSFTALGYGGWVATPPVAIRVIGVLEAIFGVAMIGFFLVTLTRKMTR